MNTRKITYILAGGLLSGVLTVVFLFLPTGGIILIDTLARQSQALADIIWLALLFFIPLALISLVLEWVILPVTVFLVTSKINRPGDQFGVYLVQALAITVLAVLAFGIILGIATLFLPFPLKNTGNSRMPAPAEGAFGLLCCSPEILGLIIAAFLSYKRKQRDKVRSIR